MSRTDRKKAAKRREQQRKAMVEQYQPRQHRDRPTPERLAKSGMKARAPANKDDTPDNLRLTSAGSWSLMETEIAGNRAVRDLASNPIDRLEHCGVLSGDQASAARQFEEIYLLARQTPATRDSTRTWEPKGHESDDGNVWAVQERRELYLFLGTIRDRTLRRVCVDHTEPKPHEIGLIREALNKCVRFFVTGRKK